MSREETIDRTAPGLPKGAVTMTRPIPPKPKGEELSPFRTEPRGAHICLVIDGYDGVLRVERAFNADVKEWHEQLKISKFPYKLRGSHKIERDNKTYHYPGRYWYKWDKDKGVKGKWTYVGKELPKGIDFSKIPAPPVNPLDGLEYERVGRGKDILMVAAHLRKFRKFFEGHHIFDVTRSTL